MSFNIFDSPKKSDITVGYVDPVLGYVTGVSINDANKYAKKNPGTIFVFETRDYIRYLNINGVNKLTPKDLASSANTCKGIEIEGKADSPSVIFTGGGGVGATGNPVFGKDGSLLTVDVISGGFGYQYPPLVEVKDETGIGVGAVTRSILVGDPNYSDCKYVDTTEVFDKEEDFEDYEITESDTTSGIRYDANGKPIGSWNPDLYANLSTDPIQREIEKYQDFLQKLTIPWWTTRKENPIRVVSENRSTRIKHNVRHPGWGGEVGISGFEFKKVTFNVYTQFGKRENPLTFKFKASDNSHSFKIKADDFKNAEQGQKVVVNVKPNVTYIVTSEGQYNGKGTEQGLASKLGRRPKEKNPKGNDSTLKGNIIFADFLDTPNENDDLQVEATLGRFTSKEISKESGRNTFNITYELKDSSAYSKPAKIDDSFMNKYAVSPVPPSNVPGSDFAGQEFTMEWEEDFPYDGEYVFRAQADNIGKFYLDNEKLIETVEFRSDQTPKVIKKNVKAGVHRIRADLYNTPIIETTSTAVKQDLIEVDFSVYGQGAFKDLSFIFSSEDGKDSFTIDGARKSNETRVETKKIRPNVNYKVVAKEDSKKYSSVEQGLIQKGKKNKEGDIGTSNKIFADYIGSQNQNRGSTKENDDIQITTNKGVFTSSNKRRAKGTERNGKPTTRNTYDLTFRVNSSESTNKSSLTKSEKVKTIFNTVDYISKADRKLWRLDPRAGKDAKFINQYGVLPFNPNSDRAKTEDFAGTHVIRWEFVEFPVDGNYNIEIMSDDNVILYIGNRDSGGAKREGNGLRSIDQGGDEIIIRKNGFTSTGKSTGKSLETRFFKAGKYRIRAELEQIKGKGLSSGNPMALAVDIKTTVREKTVVSAKSWNENPMGVALTIDAPVPPIPQEPIPPQEGRCPNNPIWTTRFPGGKEKWWPVRFDETRWGKFMNRYAISPVAPLSKSGSDGGGIVYKNSWEIDAPYDGFYGIQGTVDNGGRILIDGKEIVRGGGVSFKPTASTTTGLDGFGTSNPKITKTFISKGKHTIEVEIENQKTDTFKKVNKKIFSTKDWLSKPPTASLIEVEFEVYGQGAFKDLSFVFTSEDGKDSFTITGVTENKKIRVEKKKIRPNVKYKVVAKEDSKKYSSVEQGLIQKGKKNREGGVGTSNRIFADYIGSQNQNRGSTKENDDIQITVNKGTFTSSNKRRAKGTERNGKPTTRNTYDLTFMIEGKFAPVKSTSDGVTYSGPKLATYRSDFISPALQNVNAVPNEEIQGKTWILKWSNVDFPVTGKYVLESEADDELIVKVDGVKVGTSKVFGGRRKTSFNSTKGKKDVQLELSNIRIPGTGFQQNPVVAFAEITTPVDVSTGVGESWKTNPIGISAILIPPPCPKKVTGKGVVCKVVVDDPGNGYPVTQGSGYPAALRLRSVEVENPGINYNCGVDQIQITPSNGAQLSYECDTFGRITKVNVLNPGLGFTRYPDIRMVTPAAGTDAIGPDGIIPTGPDGTPVVPTGINASFRPQFEVVRDPIVVDPEIIIQVTDLVGLKQTGYVDGRPYYGSVFYKDGVRYAGFYQTPGELVQVYDTLQESIDGVAVTRPSAIQRQGTDISSNDPRLNIPGTPDEII